LLLAGSGAGLLLGRFRQGGAMASPADLRFWAARSAARRVGAVVAVTTLMVAAVPHLGFALAGVLGLPLLFRTVAPEAPWWHALGVGVLASLACTRCSACCSACRCRAARWGSDTVDAALQGLLGGLAVILTPQNLWYTLVGSIVGTLIGVLPGIGPLAALSLLLPATGALPPVASIAMLTAMFYGAMYGGSISSVLVNIPGEAASVVTCLDGHQMARQGRAGRGARDGGARLLRRRHRSPSCC
jgi:TctA family transporter